MILTALKTYRRKLLIGLIIAIVLSATGAGLYLVWQNRSLLEQRATLIAQKQLVEDVNEQNQATIARLQSEIIRRENSMRERAVEQDKIISEYRRKAEERDAQISQMRRDYEEIDDFLSIPVPDAFVDVWMRAKDRDENGNGLPDAAGEPDGSE